MRTLSASRGPSRRTAVLALTAALAAGAVAGCSYSTGAGPETGTITLQLADYQSTNDIWTKWAQTLAARVAQDTQNRVRINIYPNEELVTDAGSLPAVQSGAVAMTVSAPQLENTLVPGIDVEFLSGFVHENGDALRIANSPRVRAIKNQALAAKNMKILSTCFTGFLIMVSKKPLATVPSYHGMKVRVPDQPNADVMNALGALPATIPLSETYTALQLNTVTATPTTLTTTHASKFYQVAKYVDLTPIGADYEDLLINTDALGQLSPADRAAVERDSQSAAGTCDAQSAAAGTTAQREMTAAGATMVPAATDYAPFDTAFGELLRTGETVSPLARQLTAAENAAKADS